jgi:hypothetical protein
MSQLAKAILEPITVVGSITDSTTRTILMWLEIANVKFDYNDTSNSNIDNFTEITFGKARSSGNFMFLISKLVAERP